VVLVARLRTRSKGRVGRGAVLLSISVLFLGPVLSACGQSGAGLARVSFLPDPSANGKGWHWSARCQFGPDTNKTCEASDPKLRAAQLDGDEWNLGGGAATAGSLGMYVSSPGTLLMQGDFPSTPPCTQSTCLAPSAYTWVRGFPNVLYGIDQCHTASSPPESHLLPLPMKVGAIPSDLIGTTTYSAHAALVTYDVAYDLWLNKSGTKKACRTNGTLEVMVWTDYDARALLPGSMEVGTASIPFAINGVVKSGKQAWAIYASNVYGNGRTAPWGGTVWLVLNQAETVSNGAVSVDLSSALSAVGALLEHNYGWHDFRRTYWLDSIPFGMEYGPESGTLTGAGSSYFSLKLSSYCLDVGTKLAQAGC